MSAGGSKGGGSKGRGLERTLSGREKKGLVSRNKVDVVYDPSVASRRRRIEMPLLSQEFNDMIKFTHDIKGKINPAQDVKQYVIKLLETECKSADADLGEPCDSGIFDRYNPPRFPSTNNAVLGEVLTALYWRSRAQSTFLDTFLMLVDRRYLDLGGLREDIGVFVSEDAERVALVLSTFEGLRTDAEIPGCPSTDSSPVQFFINWLATMIVRGWQGDINMLFHTIEESRFFGRCSDERWNKVFVELHPEPMMIHYDPHCNPSKVPMKPRDKTRCLGFALPSGLGHITEAEILDAIADTYSHFDTIERHYKHFFGLSDDRLVTAEM